MEMAPENVRILDFQWQILHDPVVRDMDMEYEGCLGETASLLKYSVLEGDPDVQNLCRESAEARKSAYCPFSNFAVGAALQSVNGLILSGCNVENSTIGATICAERTAATKAVSQGLLTFKALAVCADKASNEITTPCGICRQFLYEFPPSFPIYCVTSDLKQILVTSLDELLPFGFRLQPDSFSFNP